MNDLIETIRAAAMGTATDEQKKTAAAACRAMAAALDGQPGQPLVTNAPATPLAALAQLDVDQVLDLVIAKLRAKLGGGAPTAPRHTFQMPPLKLPGGGGGP